MIGVLDEPEGIHRDGLQLIIQPGRLSCAPVFVDLADLDGVTAQHQAFVFRIIIADGIAGAVFIILRKLIGKFLAGGQDQTAGFVIVPDSGGLSVGQVLRGFDGVSVFAHDRGAVHVETGKQGLLPVLIIFVADAVDAIGIESRLILPEIGDGKTEFVLPDAPCLEDSVFVRHGITGGVPIDFSDHISRLVIGPVHLEIFIPLDVGGPAFRVIPFLVDNFLFCIVDPADLRVTVRIGDPLILGVQIGDGTYVSVFIQGAYLPGIACGDEHFFSRCAEICDFHQTAFGRVDPVDAGITALPENGTAIRIQVAFLIHIAILVVAPQKDGIAVPGQHQIPFQIPVGDGNDLALIVIFVFCGADAFGIGNGILVFIQPGGANDPAVLIQLADLSGITADDHQPVVRAIAAYRIGIAFFVIFRQLIGEFFAGGQDQAACFIIVPDRGGLSAGQVFRDLDGEAVLSHHRVSIRAQIRGARDFTVPVILPANFMHPVQVRGGLAVFKERGGGLKRSVPGVTGFVNAIFIGGRVSLGIIEDFRKNILIFVAGIYHAGITLRAHGRRAVRVQIGGPGGSPVRVPGEQIDRVAGGAVDHLPAGVVIGGFRQGFPGIIIHIVCVAQGGMHHELIIQARIESLGDLSVLPIGGANGVHALRAEAGAAVSIEIGLLSYPAFQGVFPGEHIVSAGHLIGIPFDIEVLFLNGLPFIPVFQLHISVPLRPGAEISVRSVIRVPDE